MAIRKQLLNKIKQLLVQECVDESKQEAILSVCAEDFLVLDEIEGKAKRHDMIREKQSEGGKKGRKDPAKQRASAIMRWNRIKELK